MRGSRTMDVGSSARPPGPAGGRGQRQPRLPRRNLAGGSAGARRDSAATHKQRRPGDHPQLPASAEFHRSSRTRIRPARPAARAARPPPCRTAAPCPPRRRAAGDPPGAASVSSSPAPRTSSAAQSAIAAGRRSQSGNIAVGRLPLLPEAPAWPWRAAPMTARRAAGPESRARRQAC